MKEFLKYTLATVIGMVIFAIVIGIIGVISLMGMVASQDASTVVKEKSVFVLPVYFFCFCHSISTLLYYFLVSWAIRNEVENLFLTFGIALRILQIDVMI